MYDISYFKADNHQEVLHFMQANPFVTICGVSENGLPIAAQIPILLKQIEDKIIISGHLMRKQDHTNAFVRLCLQEQIRARCKSEFSSLPFEGQLSLFSCVFIS